MKYRIDFYLSNDILDVDKAQKYLSSDDMTKYLKDDASPEIRDRIEHIEWFLRDASCGYIELITKDYFDEQELDNIKEWCEGQNSDGLGSGFSEQGFADYHIEEFEEYWDEETQDYYTEDVGENITCSILFYRWSEFKLQEDN